MCPDGERFLPNPDGSDWEIEYKGPRKLNAIYRVKSCPPGYFMTRKQKYPLEDECTICEVGKYLLDQNNFSACLNCPLGALCKGGADLVAQDGFWREPDNSTAFLTNESSNPRLRRQGNTSEPKIRPRSAQVHRCPPGSCGKDNMCLKNRTGPACGVCPDGYAFTSAGCEYCPPPGDPDLVVLQFMVFIIGGITFLLGYILIAATPLFGGAGRSSASFCFHPFMLKTCAFVFWLFSSPPLTLACILLIELLNVTDCFRINSSLQFISITVSN